MAIKIQGSTIIDDSRNIVNSGIATLNYQGVAEVTIGSTSVGIGSTNIFTITPQVTQTAIGVGGSEILRLSNNITNQNIFSILDSGSSPLFTVTTSGDVGIGTTNPSQKLHVDGNFLVSDGNTTVLSALSGSSSNILSVKKQSSNPAFDITGIGSVGIGTTQPSGVFEVSSGSNSLLSVKDTALAAGANIFQILDFDSNAVLGVTTVGVGIGSTNIFTITPQVTQTAIGIGTDELITLAPNSGSDNIFQVTNASGSTKHFVVTNNGNIGVGTTNPSRKLHVDGDFLVSDGSTEVLEVNGSAGNPLSIQSNSLSPAFDVTGIGSVGIGTTQPSAIFEVVSGGSEIFRISDAPSDNYLEIDTDKFVINSSGDAGIGITDPNAKLEILQSLRIRQNAAQYHNIDYSSNNFVFTANAGQASQASNFIFSSSFSTGPIQERLRIDSSGNVGIGSTQPTQKLDVNGKTVVGNPPADPDIDILEIRSSTQSLKLGGSKPTGTTSNSIISTDAAAQQHNLILRNTNGNGAAYGAITFETGDTTAEERLRISKAGNVGIGTDDASGAADPNNTTILNAGIVTANFYYGDGSGLTNLPAAAAAGSDGQVQYNNGGAVGGASALYYDDVNNRVGIGTTNPEYDLDIGGSVNAADPENAGVGTVRIAAQLGIGHTDLTRATAKPTSTYGGVLTLGGDHSTGDNPIIVFDAHPTSSSFNNILIGSQTTGSALSGTSGNVLIGGAAGNGLTGSTNIALGAQAMNHSISGSHNYGIGYRTLFGGSGDGNVAFGAYAGNSFGSGGASYNIFLGYHAGYNVGATGDYDYNIIIGAAGNGGEGFNAPKGGDKQLAIGGHRSGEDPFYWIVGDENENIGIGTTNPSGAADPNNTTILNAGIVTANYYYGDGSGLINLPAPDVAPSDGQDFNTGITTTKYASASDDIDGFTAIAVTFPSTAGRKYLVQSIHVTNISAGDLYITSRIDYDGGEDVPFTNKVIVPEQGAFDIIDETIICNPSDNIRLAAYNGIGATAAGVLNGLDCFVTYTEKTDTNYIGIGSTTKSTFTDETVFTSNTNPSVINTITLTNNSDVADIDASVSMFRGGTIRQGYFVYNLTIPQNSSVQILPKAKRLNATDTIVVRSSSTALGINVAGKYIT